MRRIQLKESEASLINQVNDANDPFPAIGRMIPSYINGEKEISFPDDQINWHGYMSQDDRIVYVAMDADECCLRQPNVGPKRKH